MEFIGKKNSVYFFNDSMGTNANAIKHSLKCFEDNIILIAGGRDHGEDYSCLEKLVRRKVKNLILIGEAKERMNRLIGDFSETFLVGTFEEAVYMAYQKSRAGDIVLFSPGCNTDEMFENNFKRGDHFKDLFSTI